MQIIRFALVFGLLGYTISKPLDSNDASDALVEHRTTDMYLDEDEQTLSYYGGLKGQFIHFKDGKLLKISGNEKETKGDSRQGPVAASSQIAPAVHINEHKATFEEDFDKIQQAAARLVAIQELAKRRGNFSPEDNRVYAASLLELGQAAQSLAMSQQNGQIHDFSDLLRPMKNSQKTPLTADENAQNTVTIEATTQEEKATEVMEQHLGESELLPPNNEDPYEDVNDSVAITPPKKDASVAEAKPIGVSIAGEGGVASSKPNAVALSGRNGLAVSAPRATAIAGVTAEEAAAFSISLPSRHNLVIKSASTPLFPPSYDDFNDTETSPLQANTLLRSAGTDKSKPKPMQATVNAADAILKMWRTAVAEEQAASNTARERNNDLERYFKISKQKKNNFVEI